MTTASTAIAEPAEPEHDVGAVGTWSPDGVRSVAVRRVPRAVTHPDAAARWAARRAELVRTILSPPPQTTVIEWAEQHLHLPSDNTAAAGQWRVSRVPYLQEIMEVVTDPKVEKVVVVKSAQLGFTVSLVVGVIGYYVDMDPCPIMVIQPTLDDAARFSKKKLMPVVRVSPRLRAKIGEARPGDSRNTILQKSGPGWSVEMVGAQSPRQMRSDSIRILLADERDAYPRSAGDEGDPFGLAVKRTLTFDNRKIITFSTPTTRPSAIEADYQDSDRRVCEVPCPHCQTYHELQWENLRWDKTEHADGTKTHHPETAHFVCPACACVIEERDKRRMVEVRRWRVTNPGHPVPGFFIWQAYSLMAKARWREIAREWIAAVEASRRGDFEKVKLFYNTVRALSYEELGEKPDTDALAKRREAYAAEVPMGVARLTMAIDVQDDWIEVLVKGWGAGEESWLIAHARLFGDVKDPHSETWHRADWYRTKAYRHESGHDLHVQVCLVDSGDGDNTLAVYDWVLPRQRQNTFAIKGDRARAKPAILRPGKTKKRAGVRLFIIGVDALKTRLFNRLRIAAPEPGPDGRVPPTPGFLHFPQPQELGCDDTYLKQFGNEKLVPRRDPKTGQTVRRYVKTGPNEAVDLDVYCLAGLHVLGDAVRLSLGTLAQALARPAAGSGSAPVRDGAERSRRVAAASPVDAVVRPPAPVAAPANAPPATGRRMRSGGVV